MLSQARFDQQKTLQIKDLPFSVFGSTDDEHNNIVVEICFDNSFSVKANIDWSKNVVLYHSLDPHYYLARLGIK